MDSAEGHKELSRAMNATGRPMILELCRGPYQEEDHWGYAPGIAQVWRATGDHHDEFLSSMAQINALKGKGNWSGVCVGGWKGVCVWVVANYTRVGGVLISHEGNEEWSKY